jgi:hypothetical protein
MADETQSLPKCHDSISREIKGTHRYTIGKISDTEPPDHSESDEAEADEAALGKLRSYGVKWCESGASSCGPNNKCIPELSGIVNKGYVVSHKDIEGVRNYYVTATIEGTVNCHCERPKAA